jgi:hypothetical protein
VHDGPFISFARNAEDVVLHRALGSVRAGRYVEIGADDPTRSSVTRAFYDRGWRGVVIAPDAATVEAVRRDRPRDTVVLGQGLDGQPGTEDDVHVLVVGPGVPLRAALAGVDLRRWRPWVLVDATAAPGGATPPEEDEQLLLGAGYECSLVEGASRFYVATERAADLRPALSPRHELEQELAATREALAEVRAERDALLAERDRWRGPVLARWVDAVGSTDPSTPTGRGSHEIVRLKEELAAMRATVSWRITAPLRALQLRRHRGRR